jgi:hypothetical protein
MADPVAKAKIRILVPNACFIAGFLLSFPLHVSFNELMHYPHCKRAIKLTNLKSVFYE